MDVRELGGGRVAGEPVEHAAGPDRGELLAVTDSDQLRPGALHELGQGIEALVVDHPSLVQDDRRVPAHVDGPRVCAGDQRVQGECLSGERGAVRAEPLCCGAGHGDPDRLAPGVLLRAGGGVDHHSLAGPGWADEDRGALGTGEDFERVVLLGAEWSADALGDLTGSVIACDLADVPACGLGELGGAAFDRLLLGTHRQGRHPPALQGQHAPVADHLPRDAERLIRRHLPGGLLQHDRAKVTLLEHGVLLGQLRLDPILDRALGCRTLGCADQPHGLIRPEPVIASGLCPHSLQVRACGQLLRRRFSSARLRSSPRSGARP